MASVPRPADAAAAQAAVHPDIHAHRILILDFGAQYTQLIARRVRELGVYCEIHPWDVSDAEVRAFGPRGVILSGGPESVTDAGTATRAGGGVRARRAGARHLLRHADHGAAARRQGGALHRARIRLRRGDRDRRLAPARSPRGPSRRRGQGRARCVDEPRRSGRASAGGFRGQRRDRHHPVRRHDR